MTIDDLIRRAGLTQSRVAEMIGTQQSRVSEAMARDVSSPTRTLVALVAAVWAEADEDTRSRVLSAMRDVLRADRPSRRSPPRRS